MITAAADAQPVSQWRPWIVHREVTIAIAREDVEVAAQRITCKVEPRS